MGVFGGVFRGGVDPGYARGQGGGRRRYGQPGRSRQAGPPPGGWRRRPAYGDERSGFGMFGPVPTWSGRTRRGSRVRVGGCCLPIPLVMATGVGLTLRQLLRR